MTRRAILSAAARASLGLAALAAFGPGAHAQRPANPIYRPRPGRPGAPARGRLAGTSGGVAGGAYPGAFRVRGVDSRQGILQLADDDSGTADVAVEPTVFDLAQLKPGDEVEVDFIVQPAGAGRLKAAAVWKLERVPAQ